MMKFVKGVMIGSMIWAGAMWMYNETSNNDKKKMMKKGKKILKEMGM